MTGLLRNVVVDTNFNSDGKIRVVVESFSGLFDHFAHQIGLVYKRRTDALFDGPLLWTPTIDLDTVAIVSNELRCRG